MHPAPTSTSTPTPTPTPPDDYARSVADLEEELDDLYPDWDRVVARDDDKGRAVKGKPFQGLAYPRLARLKWLLKRREHLTSTEGEDLADHGVLVKQSNRDPRKCFAVTILPAPGEPRPKAPARVRGGSR